MKSKKAKKKSATRYLELSPRLLQRGAMLGMTFLVLLSFLVANFHALLWQTSDWLVGAILPAVVVDLTNSERQALAAAPLTRNAVLDQAATLKAEHMAKGSYFSHNSPDGVTPWHWFREVGYTYAHAGENLAVYFNDSNEVVEAWMDSPTHRANIVNNLYQEIGIGTARGRYQGHDTIFVVQLFGTPAQIAPPKTIAASEQEVSSESQTQGVDLVTVTEEVVEVEDLTLGQKVETEAESEVETKIEAESELAHGVVLSEVQDREYVEEVVNEAVTEDKVTNNTNNTNTKESIFLSQVSTSSGLLPVISRIENRTESPSFGAGLATQPNKLLRYLYLTVGSLTILALWSSILLAWRRRQTTEIGYGLALLLLMTGLFYVHQLLTSGAVIV